MKKFRFKTRTRSIGGDYRVFGNNGTDTGTTVYPESEFKPVADTAEWYEEPCVAMYEDDNGIYVAAFGLERGEKDFANRPKGFHFYAVFENKYSAWSAFTRMIFEWSEAESVMRSSIREEKSTKGARGEDVYFDEKNFTYWLQGKREIVKFTSINPNDSKKVSLLKSGSAFMPKENCVLKWDKGGDEIYCFRAGENKIVSNNEVDFDGKSFGRGSVGIEDDEQRTKKSSGRSGGNIGKIIAVACLIVCLIGLSGLSYSLHSELNTVKEQLTTAENNLTTTQQKLNDVQKQLTAKEEELKAAQDEIESKDKTIEDLQKQITDLKKPKNSNNKKSTPKVGQTSTVKNIS